MKKNKRKRIRYHTPFYKLWYFYLIFFIFLVKLIFYSAFFRGVGFTNPLVAILLGIFVSLFGAFFVSMAIHLIHDASWGNKKFKRKL